MRDVSVSTIARLVVVVISLFIVKNLEVMHRVKAVEVEVHYVVVNAIFTLKRGD